MRNPGNQPSCIACRVSENEPVMIAWLAMMVATVASNRGELEEGIAAGDRMVEEERRLAGIVEEERRQHDSVPGGHDRISADMPHIGEERLAPGDRQEDAAENGEATPPIVHQEGDGMSWVDCGEHLRMVYCAGDAEHRDHTEP